MKGDDRGLALVAGSVADGEAIDWTQAESSVDVRHVPLVRHLRLVASIAHVYKTLPIEAEPPAPAEELSGIRWGRLILREQIGQGTSCDVHRAWDADLHRDVALKLLRDADAAAAKAHIRVLDEARRLARVEHPHIVRVYGAEQHDGRVGLWMELVRGQSLDQIVRTRGPFSPAEAAVVGQELCAALAAVHGAGLLHRDVKAQNVMRDSGGRIVLMDFGTGEILRQNEGTARFVGTPLYLAPEIFEGRPASVQSDLYSLGVLLFYLVTGEFPQTAASMEQLAAAHTEGPRRRLRDVRPDLPAEFVAVVERALDRAPDRRYRTAGEMETALRQSVQTDRAEAGATPATIEPPPAQWIGVAAALGLVLAALALIVWTRQQSPGIDAGAIKTVAVAPMKAIDPAATPPFFAEGLTDQLIATLGQIKSLRVKLAAPLGAANAASGGNTLDNVDAVLETTVLVAAAGAGSTPRVRVNARLIAAGTHTLMWSRTFEQPIEDTFRLQSLMARDIAEAVQVAVTPVEQEQLDRARRTTPEAEAAFLEGRAFISGYAVGDTKRALDAFQRAITADPGHAAAHAGAARAHFTLGFANTISQPVARVLALEEAKRALALDDTLPEAHATLADVAFYYDWNWTAAEAGYLRSLELNNSFAYGRTQYAQFLAAARRTGEAVTQAERLVELQGTSADAYRIHGLMLFYNRDYAAARTVIGRSLEFDRNAPGGWTILCRISEAEGRLDETIAQTDQAVRLTGGDGAPAALRVQQIRLLALTGKSGEAHAALDRMHRDAEERAVLWNPQFDAYVQLALGEIDQALKSLEQAAEQRQPSLLWIAVDPRFDTIRQHPRFVAVLRRLGLD